MSLGERAREDGRRQRPASQETCHDLVKSSGGVSRETVSTGACRLRSRALTSPVRQCRDCGAVMRKAYIGVRLRRLREERGMTQAALAAALGLSTSYLNQLEKNQRPLTVPVLLKINEIFGVDVQLFSEGDEARLIADLRDVLSELQTGAGVSLTEVRELAS